MAARYLEFQQDKIDIFLEKTRNIKATTLDEFLFKAINICDIHRVYCIKRLVHIISMQKLLDVALLLIQKHAQNLPLCSKAE